jgi:hypothetical protein
MVLRDDRSADGLLQRQIGPSVQQRGPNERHAFQGAKGHIRQAANSPLQVSCALASARHPEQAAEMMQPMNEARWCTKRLSPPCTLLTLQEMLEMKDPLSVVLAAQDGVIQCLRTNAQHIRKVGHALATS